MFKNPTHLLLINLYFYINYCDAAFKAVLRVTLAYGIFILCEWNVCVWFYEDEIF